MAFFFGASAGIDAFYVSWGIISLFTTTGSQVIQTAAMPQLEQIKISQGQDSQRDLLAVVFWLISLLFIVISFLILINPAFLVRIFANGFDVDRVNVSVAILLLLLPWGGLSLIKRLLDTWALLKEEYILPTIFNSLFNIFAIPIFLVGIPVLGVLSVPVVFSLSFLILVSLMFFTLNDFPIHFRKIHWEHLKKILNNCIYCLGLTGALALYQATDKFFASRLSVGSVSSLGYSTFLFNLTLAFVGPTIIIYLAKSCKMAVVNQEQAKETLTKCLYISWAYFLPLGIAVATSSRYIVSLLLGYGAFGREAIILTSNCLSIFSVVLPIVVCNTVFGRYSQSVQNFRLLAFISYCGVILNVFLDWILSRKFGLIGISLATSIIWFFNYIVFIQILVPSFYKKKKARLISYQICISLTWGGVVYLIQDCISFLTIPLVLLCFIFQIFVSEKIGLMVFLPNGWLPHDLIRTVLKILHMEKKIN